MSELKTTIICKAAVVYGLRALSVKLGKGDLAGMFTSGLSASGKLPATHYISSGYLSTEYLDAIADATVLFKRGKQLAAEAKETFPFTQLQVSNALAACIVHKGTTESRIDNQIITVEETPHELIARLGLKLVQES